MGTEAPEPADLVRRKVRLVIFVSFSVLLALMISAGVEALSVVRELNAREVAVRRAMLQRTLSVALIQVSVSRYSDGFERYLRGAEQERARLTRLAEETEVAVRSHPPAEGKEERALVQSLTRLLGEQRLTLQSVIVWGPAECRIRAPRMLASEVLPRRERLNETVNEIAVSVGRQLGQADNQMQAGYENLHDRLNSLLLLTLAAGLVLSLSSGYYILRLQRKADSRYRELALSRGELRSLSARLVDAQETERRAIARELHDEVGQSLGAMLVDLGRLSARIPATDVQAREELGQLRRVAETASQKVRNIALLLRPSMLDDLGLAAALEWQAREVSRRGEMEVDVSSEGVPGDLPDEVNTTIYRIVQEALNNAARHSSARNAHVTVTRDGLTITVTVRDDGRGFDPGKTRGMGILGMQERAERLGGTLRIDSRPGAGTVLTAELPLQSGEKG
jgi:signal transduction histidine kinase